ncbi:MAG: DedA family protein [Pirellulales bacterium]|nr:DedA family protein [Pirellulales bacterium]
METLRHIIDLFLHLDVHLREIVAHYAGWSYAILFAVIFCETGLVVTPFLPGDSLLFAAGAIAATGALDPWWLFLALSAAAILGDTVNYWLGHYVGPRAFTGKVRFLKKEHLDRTHRFFEKYGGKTIILARFVPIVRTFAPFVAGIGAMSYGKFILYNVVGGIAWVAIFIYAGFKFAKNEFVQKNFSLVILVIVIISVLPMVFEYWRARREAKRGEGRGERGEKT